MKFKPRIHMILCLSFILLMATGCSYTKQDSSSQYENKTLSTIIIPDTFEGLSGMDENELIDYFEKNGEGNYEDLKIVDGHVEFSVTEKQRQYWMEYAKKMADSQETTLTASSKKYHAECNEAYDTINAYYDTIISFKDVFKYVGKAEIYCALYQIFDGKEKYSLSLNVYNVDTGKLVAGGNLEKDDVSYDNTEWKASYTLDSAEISELKTKHTEEGDIFTVKSTFIDGMSTIDILQSAGGNGYQYIYFDDNGSVSMKADNTQRDTLLANMEQYLSDVSKQFSELGDGYEITWKSDFSSIDFKFDSKLSKQDQSNYFIYVETICMLNQVLESADNSYYIDLNIYDSSTGELVSTGNTKDGISWNIG